ncbi:MAG: PhzF family phenazine biosynthesis protein [Bacteroidales bacterium]|nr:PhzF family phenazine biosynthesis protein [Bacteroidales bacterium]MCF8403984.1 PhzF family phenazine biosynthesis protein [Bacteroidales bacterium]
MNTLPIYQIDAFTSEVFKGNPAAVCPLNKWLPEDLLQKIAMENNLSETAFLVPNGNGFDIRWFTPKIEVDLCGHATLAAAHVLFNHLKASDNLIVFKSLEHENLVVRKETDLLSLEFPSTPPRPVELTEEILLALGKEPKEVLGSQDLLAVYENEDDILSLRPDYNAMKKLDYLGVIVTSKGKNVDFVSRFFAPKAGIDEDPVTGSAHTILIPYWAKKLKKSKLLAHQISERKGELFCQIEDDKVLIGGRAVTYLIGEIHF